MIVYIVYVILDSAVVRSIVPGDLTACPQEDLVPLIRQGSYKFLSKLEVACAIDGIASSKPGYTEVQSQQKKKL